MKIKDVVLRRHDMLITFFEECGLVSHVRNILWSDENFAWSVERKPMDNFNFRQYLRGVKFEGADRELLLKQGEAPRSVIKTVNAAPTPPTVPHYYKKTLHGVLVDVNRIAQLYDLGNGPRYHMTKKLLRGACKANQSELDLITELRGLLNRWEQMINEDLQFASENESSANSDQ